MTDLVDVASGQLGYVEGGGADGHSGNITKFGQAYGLNGYAWCSMFVWWCFLQLGVDVRHTVSGSYAGAEAAMEGFRAKGWEITQSPQRNDVVFFHFPGEAAGADHTGIVVSADAGGVHTIEGNTSSGVSGSQSNGGGVYARYRPYSSIIGYGRYPMPASNPATKYYPTLKQGSVGSDVKRLQYLLHITADGVFGPNTTLHVKQAQFNRHLVQDGIAGPATLRALGF